MDKALVRSDLETSAIGVQPRPCPESLTWWVPSGADGRKRGYSRSYFNRVRSRSTDPETGKEVVEWQIDPRQMRVLLADVKRILEYEKERRGGRYPTVAIVTHGFLKKSLSRGIESIGSRVLGSRHFGATTGMNDLQEADVLLHIGIHRPGGESYVRTALLLGFEPDELDLAGLDGDGKPVLVEEEFLGERVRYHRLVGEREEEVYWKTVIPEHLQAAGRARQHLSPTTIYHLSSHPLPIPGMELWPPCASAETRLLRGIEEAGQEGGRIVDLAGITDVPVETARKIVRKHCRWGKVDRVGHGVYAIRNPARAASDVPEAPARTQSQPGSTSIEALRLLVIAIVDTSEKDIFRIDRKRGHVLVRASWAKNVLLEAGFEEPSVRKDWAETDLIEKRQGRLTVPARLGTGGPVRCFCFRVEKMDVGLLETLENPGQPRSEPLRVVERRCTDEDSPETVGSHLLHVYDPESGKVGTGYLTTINAVPTSANTRLQTGNEHVLTDPVTDPAGQPPPATRDETQPLDPVPEMEIVPPTGCHDACSWRWHDRDHWKCGYCWPIPEGRDHGNLQIRHPTPGEDDDDLEAREREALRAHYRGEL